MNNYTRKKTIAGIFIGNFAYAASNSLLHVTVIAPWGLQIKKKKVIKSCFLQGAHWRLHVGVDFGQHEKWSMDPRWCQMSTPLAPEMAWVYSSLKWAPEFSGFQQCTFNFFVLVYLLSPMKCVPHFLLEAMPFKVQFSLMCHPSHF